MKKLFIVSSIVLIVLFTGYAGLSKHRSYEFSYKIVIGSLPPGTKEVKVWVPYPAESSFQKVEEIDLESLWQPVRTIDKKYKNKILYYLIQSPPTSPLRFVHRYNITRHEYTNNPKASFYVDRIASDTELKKYLQSNKLVTLSRRIKKLAADITKGKESAVEKAKALYTYVFKNLSYDKTVPGWGLGDTERACDIRKGNCTDFHSLFISLARASNIPAKFVMGVPIPPDNKGKAGKYHCWGEFYLHDIGWVPVDISEAWKDKSKYEYFFGTIGPNRIEFSHGRDIILEPRQTGEPLNYFLFPHVEVDGKRFDDVDVVFEYQDVTEKGYKKADAR